MTWLGVRHLPGCKWVDWFMGGDKWRGIEQAVNGDVVDKGNFRKDIVEPSD